MDFVRSLHKDGLLPPQELWECQRALHCRLDELKAQSQSRRDELKADQSESEVVNNMNLVVDDAERDHLYALLSARASDDVIWPSVGDGGCGWRPVAQGD